jgi:hypothetical protein
MGRPLAMDMRAPALAAVDGGMSRRAAAGRFGGIGFFYDPVGRGTACDERLPPSR